MLKYLKMVELHIFWTYLIIHIFSFVAKEFNTTQRASVCVNSSKGQADIKRKLTDACSADDRVDIAKKFCIEERKGTYFCLKDGKCIGDECMGCIRHECEVDGKRWYVCSNVTEIVYPI